MEDSTEICWLVLRQIDLLNQVCMLCMCRITSVFSIAFGQALIYVNRN